MKINCFTCKYGYEDERLGILMCHHPKRFSEDCVNFNMYEEKEIKGLKKSMEQEKEVKSCHRTRKRLAEWSKTPEGRIAYEKVAEEMRNESEKFVSNGLEEEAQMNEREKQIIYDALCEILIIAKEHNGYYQCNYSMDEIQKLAEKYKP